MEAGPATAWASRDKRFTYATIFAAVEPGTDNAFALVMPYADTPAMQIFLDQFSETIASGEHAVMILDQAGWHGSAAQNGAHTAAAAAL